MAWVALEGMQFHAFHGVYDAEKMLGTTFIVDVYIETAIKGAAKSDDLAQALNYETVYQICKTEMEKPRNLIEAVLGAIAEGLKRQFKQMTGLKLRIQKLNPPLGGHIGAASVTEEYRFLSSCPRCGDKFINYAPDDCWARFPNLHVATRESLDKQFGGGCLCDECLQFYAG